MSCSAAKTLTQIIVSKVQCEIFYAVLDRIIHATRLKTKTTSCMPLPTIKVAVYMYANKVYMHVYPDSYCNEIIHKGDHGSIGRAVV